MSEPFVGEIKMFAGNFAPRGWAFCDGQLLAVSQNDALFSLLGTIYGGDGRTTFGLPDMRGRIPLHQGTGPGLSSRKLGSQSGSEQETLNTTQLPSHNHDFVASLDNATSSDPQAKQIAPSTTIRYLNAAASDTSFSDNALGTNGDSRSHTNIQPSLCIHYIIALFGIYPSRN